MKNSSLNRVITKDDFVFEKEIGIGSFSRVYEVLYKPNRKKYAAKVVYKLKLVKENKTNQCKIEKKALQMLNNHPHIIKLFCTFQDKECLYFILEFAPNGEILDYLHLKPFSLQAAIHYAGELLNALEFMHGKGIIHRDVKPENILLSKDYHLKLSDFGTALFLDYPREAVESNIGTAEYLSPEGVNGKPCDQRSDYWSFACVLYQMLTGKLLFDDKSEYLIMKKILAVDHCGFPENFPWIAKDLIEKILVLEPEKRLSLKEIKEHPFFESISFEKLHQKVPPPIIGTEYICRDECYYSGKNNMKFVGKESFKRCASEKVNGDSVAKEDVLESKSESMRQQIQRVSPSDTLLELINGNLEMVNVIIGSKYVSDKCFMVLRCWKKSSLNTKLRYLALTDKRLLLFSGANTLNYPGSSVSFELKRQFNRSELAIKPVSEKEIQFIEVVKNEKKRKGENPIPVGQDDGVSNDELENAEVIGISTRKPRNKPIILEIDGYSAQNFILLLKI